MAEDGQQSGEGGRSGNAGAPVALWLALGLLLGAGICWATGVPFAAPLLAGSGAALIIGVVLHARHRGSARGAPEAIDAGTASQPPSAALAVLTLLTGLMILMVAVGRGMSSAPTSPHDLTFQSVGLLTGLGVFLLALLAFALPAIRRHALLITLAISVGLILFDWGFA